MNQELQSLIDGTLEFVEVASFGMKRACDEITVHRAMQKKAADLQPELLALLIKTGAVREDQSKEAAAMLGQHDTSLVLLKSAVEELAATRKELSVKKASALGHGESEKRAYSSQTDPYTGRKTSQPKDSDRAILAVLDPPGR